MLDKDIIDDIDVFDFGASRFIYENIKWLIKQIDILIQCKKAEITAVKSGALYSTDPKIIIITMLHRPLQFPPGSQMEKIVSLRSKFNNALNDIAYDTEHSILSVDSCNSESHYDLLGNLNHFGQCMYWRKVDFLMQEFNKKKVELLPIRHSSLSSHRDGSGDNSAHC